MMRLIPVSLCFAVSAFAYTPTEILLNRDGCRREIRRLVLPAVNGFYSPIEGIDRPEDLVENPATMVRSPVKMEEANLTSGASTQTPWSDSYWPLYKGGIGERYQDDKFMSLSWEDGRDYVKANSALDLVRTGNWDALSPAEKHDLVFEAKEFPFTKASWDEGKVYYDRSGNVETWMGHCHGWAAASVMMPEPKKKVNLGPSPEKRLFYPSDIKGLASVLWSKGFFATKFIGGRCNTSNPSPRANNCLDTNPGTWHLAVVNQLGVSKRPFIMDARFDYEVWNHPVYAYEYTYLNPKTRKPVRHLKSALLKRGSFNDPLERHRSPGTVSLLGISMRVSYVLENIASLDEDQPILTNDVTYEYDLELDARGEVIGGEWYTDQHPDFLWVPVAGSFPYLSPGNFDFSRPSEALKRLASQDARRGLPFAPFVKFLVEKSSR